LVGDEADGVQLKVFKDGGGKLVVAAVGFVAQLQIGFDGVAAAVLKLVGAKLGHQADAATLLLLVEKDAGAVLGDEAEGELELLTAVAAKRVKDIAGQALGVNAKNGSRGVEIAHDQGYGLFNAPGGRGEFVVAGQRMLDGALEAEDTEVAPSRGKVGVGYLAYAYERHGSIIRFKVHRLELLQQS